jgi:wobble nucleotide-excising tRNase
MITKFLLLRNIGQFDSVAAGATLPMGPLALFYAENGRGKTTLAAVLRSLATGDPIPVTERQRLSSPQHPHVVVECAGGPPPQAIFQNGAWSRVLDNVAIFDDAFVDANVYSGLSVDPEHRQRLHEFVIGAQGVRLHREVEAMAAAVEAHNTELRRRAGDIPLGGMNVEAFCALPANSDVDAAIEEVERRISAVHQQDPIRGAPSFDGLRLPSFDSELLAALLGRDLPALDTTAATRVQAHLASMGTGGEAWLSEGLRRLPAPPAPLSGVACPFCAQDLAPSATVNHYRAYFSAEYEALKRSVADASMSVSRAHGGDVPAAFERAVRVASERRQFWSRFTEVPEIRLDTAEVARVWKDARTSVLALLEAKRAAPLEKLALTEAVTALAAYEAQRDLVSMLDQQLQAANKAVLLVKEQSATGNSSALQIDLARLKSTKARHSPDVTALCDRYEEERAAKARTATRRDAARVALDRYRTGVFPAYQQSVNDYLQRFNAGFRIDNVTPVNTRAGTACNYTVLIANKPVPIAGGAAPSGAPSFRNTLSAGDRNTLALAFFLASIDQDPNLSTKTVVVDDPMSSLDEHRSLATVQELRRLAQRVGQVIVLSHDRRFLGRIWDGADGRAQATACQIVRDGVGSTLASWDVQQDAATEYDKRHTLLRNFLMMGRGNSREVARAIRPVLEGYMRVARPEHFPPGALLGPFLGVCAQRVGSPGEILRSEDIRTLREIVEFANRFHHDTNPAWETETINDGELRGFMERALAFVGR